jgi:hypothetical protein
MGEAAGHRPLTPESHLWPLKCCLEQLCFVLCEAHLMTAGGVSFQGLGHLVLDPLF